MRLPFALCLLFAAIVPAGSSLAQAPPATDPLGRGNPRSAVTAFLEACEEKDYAKAAQYLDLDKIPSSQHTQQGPRLAQQLEAVLDSDGRFNPLRLSQYPQGDLTDDPDPAIEHAGTVRRRGQTFELTPATHNPKTGAAIWLFSSATVGLIPELTPGNTGMRAAIEAPIAAFPSFHGVVGNAAVEMDQFSGIGTVVISAFPHDGAPA